MAEPLDRIMALLAKLPGVGKRSAERMAMALSRDPAGLMKELASALLDASQRMAACEKCGRQTLRDENPCGLCADPRRDDRWLCVVEDPSDIDRIERAGVFRGRYHALLGRISPMRGEGIAQLRIDALLERVRRESVREVLLALNTDTESDATASFLRDALAPLGVTVTRLARGIPTGSAVAYADTVTLARAIENRQGFKAAG